MAHTTIHVTLIDGATGRTLGLTDLPLERLPANFETSTTLHLGDQDWHVEKAEPPSAEEFGRTGALTLTLRQVHWIDPRKVLFTLPTLDATVPPLEEANVAPGRHTLALHEDDWRQIEFVSAKFGAEIEAELADIATIYREFRVDNGSFLGFREIHMRKRIPSPLDPLLTLDAVEAALGVPTRSFDAVSFERMPGIVPTSWAVQSGDLIVYGAGDARAVRYLCLGTHRSFPPEPILSGLQRLMAAHRLYLVDWCRMVVLAPDDASSVASYFSGE